MAGYQFGSVVPGSIDAFTNAYQKASAGRRADETASITQALGVARLNELMSDQEARRALPENMAALERARAGMAAPEPSIATYMDPRTITAAPPAESPLAAGASAYGIGANPENPQQATYEQPAATPMTVTPPTAVVPPNAPPELAAKEPAAFSHSMAVAHPALGPQKLAQLFRTQEGRGALAGAGYMTNVDFEKRQLRLEAKTQAAKKYAEAQELYMSGDPDKVAEAHFTQAAADNILAQGVDNPTGLMARSEARQKLGVDLVNDKAERQRAAVDYPKLFGALQAYKAAMTDPQADKAAASASLYETLGGVTSKTARKDADAIIAKLAGGLIDEMKLSPTAAFDQAIATTIGERRDKGGELSLGGIYQDAAKKDPAAFAQYLNYVMTPGKEIPKPLLGMLGLGDVPTDPVHLADNVVTQVEKVPRGSAQYYSRLREVTKEIVHERNPQFGAEARKTESMDRDAAVRLHKQLQDGVKEAQKALKDAGGEGVASPELADEVTSARERLRAHEAAMTDKKYLAPSVRDAGKGREAQAPPTAPTKDAAVAELKRLMDQGDTLEAAKAKMKKKGWQ